MQELNVKRLRMVALIVAAVLVMLSGCDFTSTNANEVEGDSEVMALISDETQGSIESDLQPDAPLSVVHRAGVLGGISIVRDNYTDVLYMVYSGAYAVSVTVMQNSFGHPLTYAEWQELSSGR